MLADEHQRHEDATRAGGRLVAGRTEWITSRLKTELRRPAIEQRTTREETATDELEMKQSLLNDGLTPVQRILLWWHYGPDDLTIAEIARRLRLPYVTVERERHAALESLIRVCFDEPAYVLPHRTDERPAVDG
jgi:hypothetical protein